jgi:hypothetical protein
MTAKRYKALLMKLVNISSASVPRARRVFGDLLSARVGDPVEIAITAEARHALQDSTDTDIARWQHEIHERLVNDVRLQHRSGAGSIGQGISLEKCNIAGTRSGISLEVDGELGQLLAMQAYILVRSVGTDQLLECDCRKIFVRVGKRKFCSERCQKRVYMRRFRAGDSVDEE